MNAYRGGRDKDPLILNVSARWTFCQYFMVINTFHSRQEKRLKCHSCGNSIMRLTLDVAMQILVK
jgi:hypothetical protein